MDDNNSNSNKSVQNVKISDLDAIIKDVKIQIRRLFGGYKEQIERIGNIIKAKGLIKEEDICTEIKNALREEIKEKIISSDTIERCCPDEWKRKTKPKDSIDPQLRIYEDKNPLEQETVTNTNTNANITSGDQILQQEFEPDHSKIVDGKEKEKEFFEDRQEQKQIIKEQEEELKRLRALAEVAKEQESEEIQQFKTENKKQKEEIRSLREELHKLKEDGGEEVWTAIGILVINRNQVPLKITVNSKQKRIEHVEIDAEKIK
jgi:hypothetical protein